ncbi:hypothetical protein A0J48_012285, partial [Sphaerospermopsis aphanizomenoides BCCUSP55]|nr:hypothetical protein [Sphaerospermopsis aphanizomenoides BCCUSP55]
MAYATLRYQEYGLRHASLSGVTEERRSMGERMNFLPAPCTLHPAPCLLPPAS